MNKFQKAIALLIIIVLQVSFNTGNVNAEDAPGNLDSPPPVPEFDIIPDIWNECLESFEYRDYSKALKLVNSLIERYPNNLSYQIRRTRCISAMGKTDEALGIYDNLARKFKDKNEQAAILSEKAVVLVQQHKFKDALELLQSIDDNDLQQKNLRYMTCKAIILMANGQYEKAQQFLSNSVPLASPFGQDQYEDRRNVGFLFAELCSILGEPNRSQEMIDLLIEEFPSIGRFWLARAALYFSSRPGQVLSCLDKAEKCKDEPAIRGGILFMKVCYYRDVERNYPCALKYMQILMDLKNQPRNFYKDAYLTNLYIITKNFEQADKEINKLNVIAKTIEEQYEVFFLKLYLAFVKKDGKEIQQLLEKNKNLCEYSDKMNNGQAIKIFRIASIAYQRRSDDELAQLVCDYFENFEFSRKKIYITTFFYSVDWN